MIWTVISVYFLIGLLVVILSDILFVKKGVYDHTIFNHWEEILDDEEVEPVDMVIPFFLYRIFFPILKWPAILFCAIFWLGVTDEEEEEEEEEGDDNE